jgi:hypothetical protein
MRPFGYFFIHLDISLSIWHCENPNGRLYEIQGGNPCPQTLGENDGCD